MFGAGEGAAENQRREVRPNDPKNGTDGGPDKTFEADLSDLQLEKNDRDAQDDARSSGRIRTKTSQTKRLQEESRTA